jgi:hypothetical protein
MLISGFLVQIVGSTFYGPVEKELVENVPPSSGILTIRNAIVTMHEGRITIAGFYGESKADAKLDLGNESIKKGQSNEQKFCDFHK